MREAEETKYSPPIKSRVYNPLGVYQMGILSSRPDGAIYGEPISKGKKEKIPSTKGVLSRTKSIILTMHLLHRNNQIIYGVKACIPANVNIKEIH